jgi:ABC-type glutathione transport system ATPase component
MHWPLLVLLRHLALKLAKPRISASSSLIGIQYPVREAQIYRCKGWRRLQLQVSERTQWCAQGLEHVEKNVGGRLQRLHEVSEAFRPGVLTALVGVSGAGKTTLMDVLAGCKTGAGPVLTALGAHNSVTITMTTTT